MQEDYSANSSTKSTLSQIQRLEVIQQIDNLLATVTQAAGAPIGIEPVVNLMKFSGVYDIPKIQASPTLAEILDEVEEKAGITLTPGRVILIKDSPYQNVVNTIAIYVKAYGRGRENEHRFNTILKNENLRTS